MCDYSLEAYRTRPAVEGEEYVTHRFGTGSVGLVSPPDRETAICLAYDTEMTMTGIPTVLRSMLGIGEREEAVFARLDLGPFHDGVRFANGGQATLQQIGPGVKVLVTNALAQPLPPHGLRAHAPVRAREPRETLRQRIGQMARIFSL
ncbi:MAG: hypothetical protein R3D33_16970 [Hyphomicrobiaceae bacterium]